MPEGLQQGEKGEQASTAIEYLQTAQDKIEELIEALRFEGLTDLFDEALSALDDAAGV